jgi:hypothetical protein
MANQVKFVKAALLEFGRNRKGGVASFECSFTEHVCKAMEWSPDVPDCLKSAKPEGELQAESVELTPEQKEMAKHSLVFSVARIDDFEIVRRELDSARGKGHQLKLRYKIHFQEPDGCARLELYQQTIGEGKGTMKVSYQRVAKQEDLTLSEEQREATAPAQD